MKKIYLLSILAIGISLQTEAQFVPKNLVVSRVGNGTTALSGNTAPLSLLEFNRNIVLPATSAALVSTTSINSTSTDADKLTIAGTTVFEGQLSLSGDKTYLSIAGYDVAAGELSTNTGVTAIAISNGGTGYTYGGNPTITITGGGGTGATAVVNNITSGAISGILVTNAGSGYTSSPTVTITSSTGSGFIAGTVTRLPYWQGLTVNKVVARIDNNKSINYTTKFTNNNSGSIKSVASANGASFAVSGSRIEYVTLGQTTVGTQISSANARSISYFGNFLYYLLGFQAAPLNYYNVTGIPTAATTATSFPLTSTTSNSNGGFVFLDMDPLVGWNGTPYDVCYIAEVNSGLEKYYFNGTNWVVLNSNTVVGASPVYSAAGSIFSITAGIVDGNPVIYALTGNGTTTDNSIVAITDAGGRTTAMVGGVTPNTTFQTLATAGTNYAFRGIAFTPNTPTVLPVKVTSFKGSALGNAVSLKWSTASELNSKEYIIERSADGITFTTIGSVASKNSSTGGSYTFNDNNPGSGTIYYKLKAVDFDGSAEYFKDIVAVKSSISSKVEVLAYPNPTSGPLTINHGVGSNKGTITIIDLGGKKVAEFGINVGNTQTSINVSNIPAGNYFININNDGVKTIKLIKN